MELQTQTGQGALEIGSLAFEEAAFIPSEYTCDGNDVQPELEIGGIPERTQSLAIIMDDPDAPVGTWVHWVAYNIEPTERIEEDSEPGEQGMNDFKTLGYRGPCPPSGQHRYYIKVYALDSKIDPGDIPQKADVLEALDGHVLASGETMGLYTRQR